MNAFDLFAKLSLDTSAFENGLSRAKSLAGSFGNGLATALKVGVAALGTATTAMEAFALSAVKTGADFDKSMSQVAATLGVTVDEIDNLREFAQKMGRETVFSATQSADALNYMALAGYDAEKSMEMLPNVLNLAAAGAMDLALASDMITDTETAFGMTTERTSQMVDEMAKAASTGNTNVQQLGEAFLVVGGLAKELNGGMITLADGTETTVDGIQELEIALTGMANAGIKGHEAGTHMRNMLLKLSDPTKDGAQALEDMGVAIFNAEGQMRSLSDIFGDLNNAMSTMTQEDKIGVISDLFNARDIASAEALLAAVEQDWDKIGESIVNAEGAASQMAATQLDNLAGDVTLFKSALEGAKIAISDQLTPSLRDFVKFGSDGLQKLTSAFKEGGLSSAVEVFGNVLSDGLNIVIDKIPEFLDGGSKLLSAIGQGLMDNLDSLIEAGVAIAEKLGEALINGIPALIEVGLRLIDALLKSFADNLPQIVEAAKQFIAKIKDSIVNNASGIMESGKKIFEYLRSSFISNIPTVLSAIPTVIQSMMSFLVENVPTAFESFLTDVMPVIQDMIFGVINELVSNVDVIIDGVATMIQQLIDAFSEHFPEILAMGTKIVEKLIEGLVDAIPNLIQGAINLIGSLVEFILGNLGHIVAAGIRIVLALINGIFEAIPSLVAAIPQLIVEIVSSIIKSLPEIFASGVDILASLIEGIFDGIATVAKTAVAIIEEFIKTIGGAIAKLIEAGKDVVDAVKKGVYTGIEKAKEWGSDLINNFVEGIKAKWQKLKDTVSNLGQTIKNFLGFSEPEEGPLSNFHTFAPDMMKLFAEGIEQNTHLITDQISKAFDFSDQIEDLNADVNLKGNGQQGGNTQYIFNINEKIDTPDEIERAARTELQYLLVTGG